MGTMSRTSKRRSKDTRAVITSRLRFESWVSGAVEPGQVGGRATTVPTWMVPCDCGHPAEPVDEGGGQGGGQREGDEEEPGVGGLGDADVAHPARLGLERGRLGLGMPEQLDQHGAAHLEALLHDHVHLAVEVVALLGQRTDALADEAGRDEEDGDRTRAARVICQFRKNMAPRTMTTVTRLPDDVGEQVGECLLGPDDVVVEPADQGAGLGPGEEGQGHALNVAEHLRARMS